MIIIEKKEGKMMQDRTEYSCPECGTKDVFFRWSPKNCPLCDCDLPDLCSLSHSKLKDKAEIIKWHFSKDTV